MAGMFLSKWRCCHVCCFVRFLYAVDAVVFSCFFFFSFYGCVRVLVCVCVPILKWMELSKSNRFFYRIKFCVNTRGRYMVIALGAIMLIIFCFFFEGDSTLFVLCSCCTLSDNNKLNRIHGQPLWYGLFHHFPGDADDLFSPEQHKIYFVAVIFVRLHSLNVNGEERAKFRLSSWFGEKWCLMLRIQKEKSKVTAKRSISFRPSAFWLGFLSKQ